MNIDLRPNLIQTTPGLTLQEAFLLLARHPLFPAPAGKADAVRRNVKTTPPAPLEGNAASKCS